MCRLASFNPRPTRRSGATRSPLASPGRTFSFNPRPTRRSGATRGSTRSCSPPASFNPRPTRRSGATTPVGSNGFPCRVFQSSPDPKVGRYAAHHARAADRVVFQSSPDPKVGRYGLHLRACKLADFAGVLRESRPANVCRPCPKAAHIFFVSNLKGFHTARSRQSCRDRSTFAQRSPTPPRARGSPLPRSRRSVPQRLAWAHGACRS
jgi:hypothetical protein